ncbi:MAG: transposase [Eubacterium sp.]|nr:transposase [Eubacterium sp.]
MLYNEIKFENLFVDGTKIEANANRYTFVWKKVVHKNEVKMFQKIKTYIEELNSTFFANFSVSGGIKILLQTLAMKAKRITYNSK